MTAHSRPLALRRAYAARRFTEAFEQAMDARYAVTRNQADTVLAPDALARAAEGSEILFCCLTEKVGAEVIAHLAPTLKVTQRVTPGAFVHVRPPSAEWYSPSHAGIGSMWLCQEPLSASALYQRSPLLPGVAWSFCDPQILAPVGLPSRVNVAPPSVLL